MDNPFAFNLMESSGPDKTQYTNGTCFGTRRMAR